MPAILLTTSLSAWGQAQQYDRQTLLRVLLATEATQVAACERLGIVRDSSPEDLRKKILRLGGDAGLVTFDQADPDKMNAEVYRCQKKAPVARRGATGDPNTDHGPLLGTWAGTLRSPTILLGRDRPSRQAWAPTTSPAPFPSASDASPGHPRPRTPPSRRDGPRRARRP